jgi:hypothetical protein
MVAKLAEPVELVRGRAFLNPSCVCGCRMLPAGPFTPEDFRRLGLINEPEPAVLPETAEEQAARQGWERARADRAAAERAYAEKLREAAGKGRTLMMPRTSVLTDDAEVNASQQRERELVELWRLREELASEESRCAVALNVIQARQRQAARLERERAAQETEAQAATDQTERRRSLLRRLLGSK